MFCLAQSNPLPPSSAPIAPPASAAPAETKYAANGLTAEQEAKARELLRQMKGGALPPATAPAQSAGERAPVPPVAPPVAAAPAVAAPAAPAAPIVVPENLPAPVTPPASVPAAVAPSAALANPGANPGMTPEQELRAHQLLEQKAADFAPRPNGPTATQSRSDVLKNAEAEARALLERKQQQKSTTPQPMPAAEQKASKHKGSEAQTAVEVIPLPISGSKQQRLAQLLEAYKRDQLTAVQYHQERAKILAEP